MGLGRGLESEWGWGRRGIGEGLREGGEIVGG